jgi:hypothetical protein
MEKAIHITNLENLKFFQDKYQRIYWGVEFCQNLIPTLADTEKILGFTRENGLKFTLVTPFVTEYGLKKLNQIFLWFTKRKVACEVVINDWGVLQLLVSSYHNFFELSLGRLLTRQQRDPTMAQILEKQNPKATKTKDGKIVIIAHQVPKERYHKGMKTSYVNSHLVQTFLAKLGIKRVELNNLIQGVNLDAIKLRKSIYTPFVNISTTRFCPMESRIQKTFRINVCRKECQRYYDMLRNKGIPKILYKRGNTLFYKNPLKAKDILKMDIDRIVFQPVLPF